MERHIEGRRSLHRPWEEADHRTVGVAPIACGRWLVRRSNTAGNLGPTEISTLEEVGEGLMSRIAAEVVEGGRIHCEKILQEAQTGWSVIVA